jgi:uncharacterized protein HemX
MADVFTDELGKGVKRAEWGVIASLAISAATALFTGGIVYGQVQAQEQRLTKVEIRQESTASQLATQAVLVARIDTNVSILADEARIRREHAGS